MQLLNIGFVFIVMLGVGLVGYGVVVGDEANYSIGVDDATNESSLDQDIQVVEYDYLEPDMQDSFRKGIKTGGFVNVPNSPEFDTIYVHYRGDYYLLGAAHGDAAQGTMFFSMAGGIGVILFGTLGWYVARRWSNRSPS